MGIGVMSVGVAVVDGFDDTEREDDEIASEKLRAGVERERNNKLIVCFEWSCFWPAREAVCFMNWPGHFASLTKIYPSISTEHAVQK